ncbi:MAG TPA: bifunctional diaminohydroxyphosphoribosylaminopyrimidine deaminase/5-amino-6-(5-phosphoribosylamino)uracil reductase RibD [Blastocatellia bacterium]|nr:bifunctional diaminohydroxyphosphoribosylaminopyrimidine deaminase/5-amino-6-(5-phosphoribosylamino)uracil reductase RibD [Blastocatellia bacterium]
MTDLEYIQQTLQLAAQGAGQVSPNPLVGSVVVKDGQIIGHGYHRYAELKHAEVWALEEAGANAQGATIYINLEPCAHNGNGKRTPPCVEAIINAGIRRVVASMVDPNPKVNGRGFELLRAAGIAVSTGLMEREARQLNEKYTKVVTTGMPFVHLKTACSLDGRIATKTGESKWITGEQARAAGQALRHEYDAILVGINTALSDDPMLTDRSGLPRHRPLVRVVLDAGLRLPPKSQLVQTAREYPLLVFTSNQEILDSMGFPIYAEWGNTLEERKAALEDCGAKVLQVPVDGAQLDLPQVMRELAKLSLTSVLVEGGAAVAASVIEQRLMDKITFFFAPKIIGGHDAKSAIEGEGVERLQEALELRDLKLIPRGNDLEVTGYPKEQRA